MAAIRVVTVATHSDGWFDALKAGCARAGIPLDVLGYGEKWTGFSMKPRLMSEYLTTVHPDTVLFCVDAFDVMCLARSPQELAATFESFGTDLVLSEDYTPDSPLVLYCHKRMFGPVRNDTWLNSGAYAGRAHAIKDFLQLWQQGASKDTDDDQRALARAFRVHARFFDTRAAVDVQKKLFWTAKQNQIAHIAKRLSTPPAFVHAPGHSDMNELAQAARLPLHDHKPVSLVSYFIRNKLYLQFRLFWAELLCITLFMLLLVTFVRRRTNA